MNGEELDGPLVSILVACYQQEHLIADTLNSILAQTYRNIKIIVADDASTDNTATIVEKFVESNPTKMILLRSSKNIGITGNCRKLAEHIDGKYVCWFAGDDVMLPDKIARQVAAMEANPSSSQVYHDCEVFDNLSNKALYRYNGIGGRRPYVGDIAEALISYRCFICAMSAMHRVSMLPPGGFDARVAVGSDWLFFIEIAMNGKTIFLDEVLGRYRRHTNNVTALYPDNREELDIYWLVMSKYPERIDAVRRGKSRMLLLYVFKYLVHFQVRDAAYSFLDFLQVVREEPKVFFFAIAGCTEELIRQISRRFVVNGK